MARRSEQERHVVALLEVVRHEVVTVAEGVAGLHEKVDRGFAESIKRDAALDRKIDWVARTLNQTIDRLSERLDSHLERGHTY